MILNSLFHKFRNICIKTILWNRNKYCFTIFVHRNFRRKNHSDCEYHIVPRPRKWGLKNFSETEYFVLLLNFFSDQIKFKLSWKFLNFLILTYSTAGKKLFRRGKHMSDNLVAFCLKNLICKKIRLLKYGNIFCYLCAADVWRGTTGKKTMTSPSSWLGNTKLGLSNLWCEYNTMN